MTEGLVIAKLPVAGSDKPHLPCLALNALVAHYLLLQQRCSSLHCYPLILSASLSAFLSLPLPFLFIASIPALFKPPSSPLVTARLLDLPAG